MKIKNIIRNIARTIRFLIIFTCVVPFVICFTSFIIHTKKPHRKVLPAPTTINDWKKMAKRTKGYKKIGTCASSSGTVNVWVKKDFNFSLRETIESNDAYQIIKNNIELFKTRKRRP